MKYRARQVLPPACLIALAIAPIWAHAQSKVTVYGVFDLNVERSNHRNNNGSYGNLTQLKSDGLFGSRFGFTGTEDLGGDAKALFTLEAGMAPDTGTAGTSAKFWSRLSFVGLENGLGRVTVGRQYTGQFDVLSRFFPLTRAPQYEPYAQIESIYADNSVKFTRVAGPLKVVAHYGLGESSQGSRGSANYSYGAAWDEPGKWGVALTYDQSNTAYATTGNTANVGFVRKLVAAGRVTVGQATLYAGIRDGKTVSQNAALTSRDNLAYVGAEVQFTPAINAAIGYYQNNVHFTTATYVGTPKSVAARATYALSKRTDVYAVYGTARNAALGFNALSTLQPGKTDQQAFAVGIRHLF